MSNPELVKLIAERLPSGLLHPGDPTNNQPAKLLPLPGLRSSGLPPELAEEFAKAAGFPVSDVPKLIAEALIHLIETDGQCTIVLNRQLAEQQAQTTTPEQANPSMPTIQVYCQCNPRDILIKIAANRHRIAISSQSMKQRIEQVCSCR